MLKDLKRRVSIAASLILLLVSGCAKIPELQVDQSLAYRTQQQESLEERYAPVFVVENPEKEYNRIGTPVARRIEGRQIISVDPDRATYYVSQREFSTPKGRYTNLIYRIHFSEVPFSLIPFYLGAGKNVGVLVIVTLNERKQPVLYTMLQTCGCYLAFIPTDLLPKTSWPADWPSERQTVYGENLPSWLRSDPTRSHLVVLLREATHRVKNVWVSSFDNLSPIPFEEIEISSFASLEQLPYEGGVTSFFESSGSRYGYVKGSHKIWERLLISWWAFDWRVGEDKKLGRDKNDGIVFYTSLKPWAREISDLRDFSTFLNYWGWNL